jgi:hypothetical protein
VSTFQNQEALLLLLALIPLGGLFLFTFKKKEKITALFGVKTGLDKKEFYLILFFLLIVLGLGNPTEKKRAPLSTEEELFFLLDTSTSMSVKDTPSGVSRFEEALSFISQNITNPHLKSLILFNDTAEIAIPLTFDTPFFQLQLNQVSVEKERSTDISAPLKTVLQQKMSSNKRKVILVSDGENQSQTPLAPLVNALKNKGVVIETKILGSVKGGEIPGVTFDGEPGYSRAYPKVLEHTP